MEYAARAFANSALLVHTAFKKTAEQSQRAMVVYAPDMLAYCVVAVFLVLASVKQYEHRKDDDGVIWRKCLLVSVSCAAVIVCVDPRVLHSLDACGGGVYFARTSLIIFSAMYLVCGQGRTQTPDGKSMRPPPRARDRRRRRKYARPQHPRRSVAKEQDSAENAEAPVVVAEPDS